MIEQELLEREAQADELLLMGLRLKEGIDLVRWQALSGRDPDPDREQFLIEHGFVERLGNSRLRCTPAGMLILDAVVAGQSDPRWGERVVGIVALRKGAAHPTSEEVREFLRERLAGYKLPKALVWVDEVKRSAAGKQDYRWAKDTATADAQG